MQVEAGVAFIDQDIARKMISFVQSTPKLSYQLVEEFTLYIAFLLFDIRYQTSTDTSPISPMDFVS
jgi:hypothetical protein